jgi:hypothetical protein
MSEPTALDVLQMVYKNENLRPELRAAAARDAVNFERHKLGVAPHLPQIPSAYDLGDLTTTKGCEETLQRLARHVADGTLSIDAGERLAGLVIPIRQSLEQTEVREKIAQFEQVIEQIEERRTIDVQPSSPSE